MNGEGPTKVRFQERTIRFLKSLKCKMDLGPMTSIKRLKREPLWQCIGWRWLWRSYMHVNWMNLPYLEDLPKWLSSKESACQAGNSGLIPGLGRSGVGHGNPLCILAWKIPWPEEPLGLQFMRLQRVGHNWVCTHTHTHHLESQAASPWV